MRNQMRKQRLEEIKQSGQGWIYEVEMANSNPCPSDSKVPSPLTYVKRAWITLGMKEAVNKASYYYDLPIFISTQ